MIKLSLAELEYWRDLNNDPAQTLWSADGGMVNVYEKVFGCGAGGLVVPHTNSLGQVYQYLMVEMSPMEHASVENPERTFSMPIMAGALLG